MRFGVVVFPGSNCEQDCYYAAQLIGEQVSYIWHQERNLSNYDCVILPGGFSYGDYLRTGAVAQYSPVMESILSFASKGRLVIGICNGFQILLEAGLLPGAMLQNRDLKFICKSVYVKIENNTSLFTSKTLRHEIVQIPIAHNDGNYYVDDEQLNAMKENNQIVLKYCDLQGNITEEANPNGSRDNIAGIVNEKGNVFGLMPHPERAMEESLGSSSGRKIFESIVSACSK